MAAGERFTRDGAARDNCLLMAAAMPGVEKKRKRVLSGDPHSGICSYQGFPPR